MKIPLGTGPLDPGITKESVFYEYHGDLLSKMEENTLNVECYFCHLVSGKEEDYLHIAERDGGITVCWECSDEEFFDY